jgi:hypothetical protein
MYERSAMGLRLRGLLERGHPLHHFHAVHVSLPLSPRIERDGTEVPSAGERLAATLLADLAAQIAAEGATALSLLIFDTVRASLVGSEDASEPVSAYLRAVARLLAPYPTAAALLAHHAGWQDGETPKKRERGSSALRGNVDGSVYLEAGAYNAELGQAPLLLTTHKVRDGERPPPLRLIRSRITLASLDAFGRSSTTCLIESDPRSREDLEAEATAAQAAADSALEARVLAALAPGTVTSLKTLRLLLGVKYDLVEAALARLVQAGRVTVPTRQRAPYVVVGAGAEGDA